MKKKFTFLVFLLAISSRFLYAQWNYDSLVNNPVSTGANKNSSNPALINDGSGGYYVVWMQGASGMYPSDIYAQHINANGSPLWPANGIVICNHPADQFWPVLVSDGSGGVIITWQDNRAAFADFYIYAQRVTAAGTILWATNGVRVTNSIIEEFTPKIISDGAGGAIISFYRSQNGGLVTDVYAQRINSSGTPVWNIAGVAVSNGAGRQEAPNMIPDGIGGAIITWKDFRSITGPDIYVQRISSAGLSLWAANGIPVCIVANDQQHPRITTDGNSGAFIVWTDFRNSPTGIDIYAQHVSSGGSVAWIIDGIAVCSAGNTQADPSIVSDGAGGAVVTWYDERNSGNAIYAQRISGNGNFNWTANGISVCNVLNKYSAPLITTVGNNGVIIGWEDKRNGIDENVYAQHIAANGNAVWAMNGVAICSAPNYQIFRDVEGQSNNGGIVSDNNTGATLVWSDGRNTIGSTLIDDIYTSKLTDAPVLPVVLNITNQCQNALSAKGKLANPPASAGISITVDSNPVAYLSSDSSFQYFTNGSTTVGSHVVHVKYYNFAGRLQKDSAFSVIAAVTPSISISGTTTVNQGASTLLTAVISNGGSSPAYQWQDSTNLHNWQNIAGAVSSSLNYTPVTTGDKIRCMLNSNITCATTTNVISTPLSFVVNIVTGVSGTTPLGQIRFYPNPANQFLTIDSLRFSDKWQYIRVFMADGRMVIKNSINSQLAITINISALRAGMYIVQLVNRDGKLLSYSFIKIE